MRVIDVSDPTTPREVGILATDWASGGTWPRRMVVRDGYVYVALQRAGLRVVDARDPRHPREAGQYDPSAWVQGVALVGDVLAVPLSGTQSGDPSGLVVLSIIDPAQPQEVARLSMQAHPNDVAAAGDHAAVTSSWGVHVIDMHDPTRPRGVERGRCRRGSRRRRGLVRRTVSDGHL